MKISIVIRDGRLTAAMEEGPTKSEPRDLIAAMPVDVRAADQIAALVSKLVGMAVYDAIVLEAGGTDGA